MNAHPFALDPACNCVFRNISYQDIINVTQENNPIICIALHCPISLAESVLGQR
uniref:Uncharacterized protein n=1 Tax=Anguilla anguilla TaxID=7936 RepID=A0A0E9QAC5_ANGAN